MTRLRVTWRAAAVVAAAQARGAGSRLAAAAGRRMKALPVVIGLGGMLAGGALVGEWCLGLVLIAESGGALAVGLLRDDGTAPQGRGAMTVPEILERARHVP